MATAQFALEWKQDQLHVNAWTSTEDEPANWIEPPAGRPCDITVQVDSDFDERLREEIEQAKRLLTLENDWDGEGSPRYSEAAFERAIKFLTKYVEWLRGAYHARPPLPRIGPGPDGSVDLHWREASWELLVNIPADAAKPAVFYGDNYGTQKIRGSMNADKFNLGIAEWLMN